MKKFLISLLFTILISSLITSCSSIFSDGEEYGSVSFQLNKAAAETINARATLPADLQGKVLSVTLYANDKSYSKEAAFTENGVSLVFDRIRVGSRAYADVRIIQEGSVIAYGKSETIVIKRRDNSLNVKLSYATSGNINFGNRVKIELDESKSSKKIWLNSGEWYFKLLDEEGNDILADVDWEAFEDTGYGSSYPYNNSLLRITASIRTGHTKITNDDEDYSSYYFTEKNNLKLNESYLLPLAGTYDFTVTIQPGNRDYINKKGKKLPFPQFEPTSITYEVNVVNGISFDLNGKDLSSVYGYCDNVLKTITEEGSFIKFYGETDIAYRSLFGMIPNYFNPKMNVDCSEVTCINTEAEKSFVGDMMLRNGNFLSFILPKDVEIIGASAFSGCSSLQSVTIPASVTMIGYRAFYGCSELSEIIFEDPAEWYSSSVSQTLPITEEIWSTLDPVDFSSTEQRLQLVTEGSLVNKYLYKKTE